MKMLSLLSLAFGLSTLAYAGPELTLRRLECGSGSAERDVTVFSDTYALEGKKLALTFSCYLIQHGDQYLIWDTGNAIGSEKGPKTKLVDLLAQLKLKPEQIKYVGISHYHADHIGQAGQFPKATLLIGKGDWDALNVKDVSPALKPELLKPWISDGAKRETVEGDKDIFGDGSIVMLNMPGHTPGHHSLLVRLKEKGNVLLTGDLSHFHENYDSDGIPSFNTNRADSLASLDRFKKIAANLKATVVIQHDPRDIDKLPAFPNAAK